MINRDDIEAGDKVYTRDGGCLVARESHGHFIIGCCYRHAWHSDGTYDSNSTCNHPLDIIRIEKAPKPMVEQMTMVWSEQAQYVTRNNLDITNWPHCINLVFVNNVWDKERSEQVK